MTAGGSILVVGSLNMDLACQTDHIPAPGETVLGGEFVASPGGKGANQAVAVAKLGGRCRMIGRVGDDDFGRSLLANLAAEGVDCDLVRPVSHCPTGVALIAIAADGENSIVVASGANFRLTPEDIAAEADAFAEADVVAIQLETPMPAVLAAIELARHHGCRVILDPAPAVVSPPAELFNVDVISPNTSEADLLLGGSADLGDEQIAEALLARGARSAVLKLGSRGSLVCDGSSAQLVGPYSVEAIDTTAAGDSFTAALAVGLARGDSLIDAARLANAAGALACTKVGAQQATPTAEQVRELMDRQQPNPYNQG